MRTNKIFSLYLCLGFAIFASVAQTTTLVSVGADGKLVYTADAMGSVIPDYSGVGYRNSKYPIPTVPVVKTITAIAGDNAANIRAALSEVAAMPLQSNGFRGAILFKAGLYEIASRVTVNTSGIVLRGEGLATELRATGAIQYDLFRIEGGAVTVHAETQKKVTDAFVPIGAKKVRVESGHSFEPGDWVYFRREPNAAWITLLGMDKLATTTAPDVKNWTPQEYIVNFERQILSVNGNELTFDAPVVDIIDPLYANAYVSKISCTRIRNIGIENFKMTSTYATTWASGTANVAHDENHGWIAVKFNASRDSWVRKVEAWYFGYSCVSIGSSASFITVDSCAMYDPISEITGGRRYSFNVDGQRNLVMNCSTRNGRHDYVNGARVAGPNVFYKNVATLQRNDIGPHHRWATGILYDNITGNGAMNVQDRQRSGTGHGWAGAQIMFWNSKMNSIITQSPQSYHTNWTIGCTAPTITNKGDWVTRTSGIVQSSNKPIVAIPSLFLAQLNDRINPYAQQLPLTSADFFAATAIGHDNNLEKGAYGGTTSDFPIMKDQWNRTGAASQGGQSPMLVNNTLAYANYIDNNVGKAIVLDANNESRASIFSLTDGTHYRNSFFYLSVLVNFSSAPASEAVFMGWDGNYTANQQRGVTFVKADGDGFKIGLGASSTTATIKAWSATLQYNQTYLLVLKAYGANNSGSDVYALYINPEIGGSELQAEPNLIASISNNGLVGNVVEGITVSRMTNGIRGITVRQNIGVGAQLGGLRFSDYWSDVVQADASNVYPQKLPITHDAFFAADAMGANALLEKGAYTATSGVAILKNQWNLTGSSAKAGSSPKFENSALSYANYIDNNMGKAIVLNASNAGARASIFSLTDGVEYRNVFLYLSVLVNFSSAPVSETAFLHWDGNFTANQARGAAFVKTDGTGYKIGYGASTSSSTIMGWTERLSYGQTYLLVMKAYATNTTGINDIYALYINPNTDDTEEQSGASLIAAISNNGTVNGVSTTLMTSGVRGITIRQSAGVGAKLAGMRFSDNWADVVKIAAFSTGMRLQNSGFKAYVNADNQIVIHAAHKSTYTIYNILGYMIERGNINSEYISINTKLKSGVYVVKLGNEAVKLLVK